MATKKQRKRRQKERRHEYEIVYVDDEGQEVEVDEPDAKPKKAAAERKPAAKGKAGAGTRVIEPPSWNRTLRRALLFAPFILIFFYITRPKDDPYGQFLLRSLPLLLLIVPFMYMVDSMAYRSYQKRLEKRGGQPPKSK